MMLLSKAAKALKAKLTPGTADVRFSGVSTDTRKIQPGDLYIALRGEHFDGADFIAQAMGAGAAAVLMNADSYAAQSSILNPQSSILLVEDTRLALGELAAYWRGKFAIPVIAITGSNGKTTVKEMLAAILRVAAGGDEAVLATKGNFNNDIGMPLTLLQLNSQHRYAVIEMGMNHPGEIDYLSRIAKPQIALINNASGAHLAGMGSVEAVALAKGEIFAGLQHEGSAIINADDKYAPLWRSLAGGHSLLEFGLNINADVTGNWCPQANGLRLIAQTPNGDFTAEMQVPGEHNARNALAATAAALALNLSLESILSGLEKFSGVAGRLQYKQARGGATIIDDSYNANPASLEAAIAVLAQAPGRRILVLGDMGELGDAAGGFHAGIGATAHQSGIEKLYALGELSREAVKSFGNQAEHFDTVEALQAAMDKELHIGTTILVKGSRFMKMERVVKYLETGSRKREVESGVGSTHSPFTTPESPEDL